VALPIAYMSAAAAIFSLFSAASFVSFACIQASRTSIRFFGSRTTLFVARLNIRRTASWSDALEGDGGWRFSTFHQNLRIASSSASWKPGSISTVHCRYSCPGSSAATQAISQPPMTSSWCCTWTCT